MILNLTQHTATSEQIKAGVVNLGEFDHNIIKEMMTFDALPTKSVIDTAAVFLADTARQFCTVGDEVMIGGAPFLMAALEDALKKEGLKPVYAFSRRVSEDVVNPDGTVTKTTVFKHEGFVHV